MVVFESEIKEADYQCAYCGEINSTFVDPSAGIHQTYIEDCQVCCRPNLLTIMYNEWEKKIQIRTEPSQ